MARVVARNESPWGSNGKGGAPMVEHAGKGKAGVDQGARTRAGGYGKADGKSAGGSQWDSGGYGKAGGSQWDSGGYGKAGGKGKAGGSQWDSASQARQGGYGKAGGQNQAAGGQWDSGGQPKGQWLFVPVGGTLGRTKRGGNRMEKLDKLEADLKLKVEGLDEAVDWKKLDAHFASSSCEPSVTEILPNGSACLAFETADQALVAMFTLNGSLLDDQTIQVEAWTNKETQNKPRYKQDKRCPEAFVGMTMDMNMYNRNTGTASNPVTQGGGSKKVKKLTFKKKPQDHNSMAKVPAEFDDVNADKKVIVTGMDQETSCEELKQHFEEKGCDVDICVIRKGGKAWVTFTTSGEASDAITTVSGTEIDGHSITLDPWKKKVRKSGQMSAAKMNEKFDAIDADLKVIVSGLDLKTSWKELKEHFEEKGCENEMCVLRDGEPGKAWVTFKTSGEANIAITTVDGTELDGMTIAVDMWSDP